MKVAIPHWQDRVSPVFDSATRLLVVEIARGRERGRSESPLVSCHPTHRAAELRRSGADVLICGAISRPLEDAIRSAKIQVVAHVCGQIEEVLKAFLNDRLSDPVFLMPGCCGRHQRDRKPTSRPTFQEEGIPEVSARREQEGPRDLTI